MPYTELESTLRAKIRKAKLIHLIGGAAFLALCIILAVVREATKEVNTIQTGLFGEYRSVIYNTDLTLFAGLSLIVSVMFFIMLLAICIVAKVRTVEAGGSYITLYKGAYSTALYVDGEKKDRMGYYLEAPLRDGSTVTVSFSRNLLFTHMSFSNGQPPIDM